MFNEITEVPVAIRDFYLEVTKTEPKLDADGNQITEPKEIPSIDENGNEVMVTIQVPVFHDVVYVELKPRPETKSLLDLERVNTLHQGKNEDLIDRFAVMVNNGISYQFLDTYLLWLAERGALAAIKPVRAQNADGTFIPDDVETEENEAWVNGFTLNDYNTQLAEFDLTEPQPDPLLDIFNWKQKHFNPLREKMLKLVGVEFEGVMCSVTKEDMWGISSLLPIIQAGHDLTFEFKNGNFLDLNSLNIQLFMDVWLPFRTKFFTPNKELL